MCTTANGQYARQFLPPLLQLTVGGSGRKRKVKKKKKKQTNNIAVDSNDQNKTIAALDFVQAVLLCIPVLPMSTNVKASDSFDQDSLDDVKRKRKRKRERKTKTKKRRR